MFDILITTIRGTTMVGGRYPTLDECTRVRDLLQILLDNESVATAKAMCVYLGSG